MTKKLSRRFFLRGAFGTAIALPLMDFMLNDNGTAYAAGGALPCRFVSFFVPTAILGSSSNGLSDRFTPKQTGNGYDVPFCLQPLSDNGVKDDTSVVSGGNGCSRRLTGKFLRMLQTEPNSAGLGCRFQTVFEPGGGRSPEQHAQTRSIRRRPLRRRALPDIGTRGWSGSRTFAP